MAVNEADYTSVIVWTLGPEERQQRCEVGVVVRRCCCSSHTRNEVSSCVGGVVEQSWWNSRGGTVVMELCVFWLCESCVVLWDCLWASSGLLVASQHLIENRSP